MMMMIIHLKEQLAQRKKQVLEVPERISAAVLLPLFEDKNIWHMVFIKRTYYVSTHKGQISFPGGARDDTDADLKATALRESWEEIALRPEDTEVIGELDDEVTTTSNYIMTPFVAIMPWPYNLIRNKFEVEDILTVPLAALLDERSVSTDTEILEGKIIPSYSYRYEGERIWGATARILNKFLAILKQAYQVSTGLTEERLKQD